MVRKIAIFSLMSIILLAVALLVTGSDLLLLDLGGGFPLGNLLTWLLFIAIPLIGLLIRRPAVKGVDIPDFPWSAARILFALNLLQGIAWGFMSRGLAGNWSASFSNDPVSYKLWFYYTYSTPAFGLLGWLILLGWWVYQSVQGHSDN